MFNRIFKFRGKNINNCFEYGDLIHINSENERVCIYNGKEQVDVLPNTIGQFTGRYDMNGIEIYTGDIIEKTYSWGTEKGIVKGNEKNFEFRIIGIASTSLKYSEENYKIIGNEYDNPELLNEIGTKRK